MSLAQRCHLDVLSRGPRARCGSGGGRGAIVAKVVQRTGADGFPGTAFSVWAYIICMARTELSSQIS